MTQAVSFFTGGFRIGCSRLKPATTDQLFDILTRFFTDIRLVGYASGHIGYNNVWKILNKFDVTVDWFQNREWYEKGDKNAYSKYEEKNRRVLRAQ